MTKLLRKVFDWILRKKEKIEPPDVYAIIKLNEVAKENGIYDDDNKIIEVNRYGKIERIDYTEADVRALENQGIPVIEEEYTDEYDFLQDLNDFGGVEFRK